MPTANNQGHGRPRHRAPRAPRAVVTALSVMVTCLTLIAGSCSSPPRTTGGAPVPGLPAAPGGYDGAQPGGYDGAGGRPGGDEPLPSPPTSSPPSGDELEQHLAACAQQMDSRQLGQVRYPLSLPVQLGQEATYEASLDIRPGAVQQPAPNADTQVATVEVRCGVGARLIGLANSITVEDENEWVYLQFDTFGVFQWTWTIQATEPEDSQVRLELRPAVAVSGGGFVVPGNDDPRAPTVSYISDIDVQAGLVEEADFFASDSWPKIARMAAIAGAALLALVAFYWQLRRKMRGEDGDEDRRSASRPASPRAPKKQRRAPPRPHSKGSGGRGRAKNVADPDAKHSPKRSNPPTEGSRSA